jgi:hypothetical protein
MSSDKPNWLDAQPIDLVSTEEPEIVKFTKKPTMTNRTVLVDTNYLNQINQKDFIKMFFNPRYEETVSSAQKKQMAKLFREFRNRTIDLIFSDMVINELIGQSPHNKLLIEVYKEHIIFLSPAGNDNEFFKVSAAVNSRLSESGKTGDIKDTYSYLLSLAGNIRYFVTEDHDLRPVYDYFKDLQAKGWSEKQVEIRKIKAIVKILSSGSNTEQSERLVESLFSSIYYLPMPISLKDLEEKLPDVLDRSEIILWMDRTLRDIDSLQEYKSKILYGWDEAVVSYCKGRINEITKALGCISEGGSQNKDFSLELVEKSSKWKKNIADVKMADKLSEQLGILQELAYKEEFDPGYASLEDELAAEESEKEFEVKCDNCETIFDVVAYYDGIVESSEREMGAECCHQWSGDYECPGCGESISVRYELWEYPIGARGVEETDCDGCEIIPKPTPKAESKTSISLEKFFG